VASIYVDIRLDFWRPTTFPRRSFEF